MVAFSIVSASAYQLTVKIEGLDTSYTNKEREIYVSIYDANDQFVNTTPEQPFIISNGISEKNITLAPESDAGFTVGVTYQVVVEILYYNDPEGNSWDTVELDNIEQFCIGSYEISYTR